MFNFLRNVWSRFLLDGFYLPILRSLKSAWTHVSCLLHQILHYKHQNSLWDYPSHTISSLLFISVSRRVEQWLKTTLCSPCWNKIAYAAFDGWLNTKIISCILQGSCEKVSRFLFPDLPPNCRPTLAPRQQRFLLGVKNLWESVENQRPVLAAQANSWHFHTRSLEVVPGLCTVIGWWVPELKLVVAGCSRVFI